jgi:hypothetical protein
MDSTSLHNDGTLANRYLAEDLTEAELSAYEAYLVQNPEALRELEATARLKVGLHRLREAGELRSLVSERSFLRGPLSIALAAGIAAIVVGFGLWRPGLRTAQPPMLASSLVALVDQSGHMLPLGGTQAVFRKRDTAYDAVVALPAARSAINIRVLPDLNDEVGGSRSPSDAGPYVLSISRLRDDDSATPIASISQLQPSKDGFVDVYVDSRQLPAGRYRLTLQQANSGQESESFVIEVGVFKGP